MVKESFSIKKTAEFKIAFARKCSASDGLLIIYGRCSARASNRLGLSVSKRFGGAVQRVRWKRLVREAFRKTVREMELSGLNGASIDFVVVPGKLRRSNFMPDFQKSMQILLPTVAKKLKRGIIIRKVD